MQIRDLLNILEEIELGPPGYRDPKDMSEEEIQAEIDSIEKQLKHITPVDQVIDAGNGDTIIQNISPRDLERRNQGLPANPNMRNPIYRPDPTADPVYRDA
jgi:hypothetical protein